MSSVRVSLLEEYAPSKHTDSNDLQTLSDRRAAGQKHVDLWVDGRLYPNDPAVHYHPIFHNLSTFLQFLGRGEHGLLGYCKRLSTHESVKLQELYKHLHGMNSTIHHYQHKLDASEQLVGELKEVLLKKDAEVSKLRDNITNLKATPFGSRERKRGLSSIETLAPRSGALKRRVTATRYVLHYVLIGVNSRSLCVEICLSICNFLCFKNFLLDACGSTSNEDRIILLMSLLNKEDVLSIMRAPKGKVI